jgi:hypothetical protein
MIRVFALLLVLVNLGFLAWHFWLEPEPDLTPPLSESLPPLVLVTEAEAMVAQAPAPDQVEVAEGPATDAGVGSQDEGAGDSGVAVEGVIEAGFEPVADGTPPADVGAEELVAGAAELEAVDEPAAPEMVCRSVGPFTSQVESRRAAAMLAETGRVPLQRVTEGEVWLGYWVYLAPFDSSEAADEVAQALARALVEDFYIIRSGDLANAISLGVYSQTEGAEARLEEMRERGFPAEITDRYRSAPVYWLDFAEAADDPLPLSLLMPAAPGRVLRSESGDCALP